MNDISSQGISSAASGVRARNDEIIQRRRTGEKPRAIARSMDLSAGAVAGVLRRAGLTDPTRPQSNSNRSRPRLPATLRELVIDHRRGATQWATSVYFGISPHTVWRWVHGQ